jgi:Methyltransferase domain
LVGIVAKKDIRNRIYGEYDPYVNFPESMFQLDVQGWDSENVCFEKYIKEVNPRTIIEVGTWKGASAIHMSNKCKELNDDFEIVCVDTFLGSVEHWTEISYKFNYEFGRPILYNQFLSNIIKTENTEYITPLPLDSQNAFLLLSHHNVKADLIYIDAGHDYHSVKKDLENYWLLLREGGILIGDDYWCDDIVKATNDVFGSIGVNFWIEDSKFICRK